MPKRYKIELSEDERSKLEAWLKNPPKPHLRKRARGILLVAQGQALYKAAEHARVRVHRTTLSEWVQRYMEKGIEGLKTKKGQGRKPGFFPSDKTGSENGS